MPTYTVTFQPADVDIQVDPALYPYGRHGRPGSLLDIALTHGVEIEHACGGTGVCGTCHVRVEQGMENLSEPTDEELDAVEKVPDNRPNSRLACQAVVEGNVIVTVGNGNHPLGSEQH